MLIASSYNDKPMLMKQRCKQGFAYNSDFMMTSFITNKEMEASAILRPETPWQPRFSPGAERGKERLLRV